MSKTPSKKPKQRQFSRWALMIAVNNQCTCGGRGPKDKGVCPACMVWHQLVRPEALT